MEQLTYIRIHARELAHDDVDEVLEPSREIRPSVFQLRTERSKTCEQTFYDVDTKPLEQLGRTVYFVLSSRRIIRNTEDFGKCFDGVGHFGVDTKNHAIHKINTESLEHCRHGRIILSKRDFRTILQSQNNVTRFILDDTGSITHTVGDNACQIITKVFEHGLCSRSPEGFRQRIVELRLNFRTENIPIGKSKYILSFDQDLLVLLIQGAVKDFPELCIESIRKVFDRAILNHPLVATPRLKESLHNRGFSCFDSLGGENLL